MIHRLNPWPAMVVSSLIAVNAVQLPAIALERSQIEAIAQQSTVRIFSETPGSGVLIKREGNTYTVLTCEHVVATEDTYDITTVDGKIHPVDNATIRRLADSDLAVLEFESSKNYPVIRLGNSDLSKAGLKSYVSGFPLKSVDSIESTYRFAPGHISANASQTIGRGYSMVYPNDTFRGMSGGPVLNAAGELIGIHGQTLTAQISTGGLSTETGLKLGFNMAIPIQTFYQATDQLNLSLNVSPQPTEKIADRTADDYYLRAVEQYIYKKSNRSALDLVQKAIQLNPLYGDAYRLRGFLRISAIPSSNNPQGARRAIREAIADFDQAIRLNPIDTEALNIRGFFRIAQNNLQGAIQDFDTLLALRPNLHVAYQYRADAHSRLNNHQKALEDYSRAIRLFPSSPQTFNSRGTTRAQLGDLEGAIQDLSEAIRLNPTYENAYYNRAQVREKLGDSQGAIADFDKALELKAK